MYSPLSICQYWYNLAWLLHADDCGLHQYQNENGMVGIMIGIEHPDLAKAAEFPGGGVLLASVQVLTPAELEYVVEHRAEGRNELHQKFKDSGCFHYLETNRPSLIEASPVHEESINLERQSLETRGVKTPWWKFW
jgi:hypothetical protein